MSGFWSDIARRLSGHPTGAVADRGGDSSTESSGVRFIVGLDFGTSGSKVVIRNTIQHREPPIAVDFGTPVELGFSRFVFPSTVAVRDGKIWVFAVPSGLTFG